MKNLKYIIGICLLLFVGQSVFAQLAMQLGSNQLTYMLFEPMYFSLKIRNDSGRPMVFGTDDAIRAEVFFEVQDAKYKPMEEFPAKAVMLNQGKVINPGQIVDLVFKFSDIYKLNKSGIYRIHAYVKHPQLKETFKSNDIRIDVSKGSEIWSREIGLPENYLSMNKEKVSADKSRFFRLKTLIDGTSKYYYCVLEDSQKIYQIIRLGQVYGIDLPQKAVDMAGVLHVMVPYGSKLYKYYQVDIDGELAGKIQYLKSSKTTPRIIADNNGKVYVSGGDVAIPNVDYLVETTTFKAK